jgi:hypothetical protein
VHRKPSGEGDQPLNIWGCFIMKSYSEKLKDPRWQKKRLKILERDSFTCTYCGNEELTLHVHHKIYYANTDPWDYSDNELTTLCEVCHSDVHNGMDEALKKLITSIKIAGFLPKDINEIADGFYNMPFLHATEVVASVISASCKSEELQISAINNFFEFLSRKRNAEKIH